MRRADGAHDAGFQIGTSADEIENLVRKGIEQQAIDGEVAALHVLAGMAAVGDLIGMAAVGVQAIAAEGGDFDDFLVRFGLGQAGKVAFFRSGLTCGVFGGRPGPGGSHRHQDDTELGSDGPGLGKNMHDLLRSGVGGDVKVGGRAPEQEIAHASADKVCLVPALPQGADDFNGSGLERSYQAVSRHWIEAISDSPLAFSQQRFRMPTGSQRTTTGLHGEKLMANR